VTDIRVAMLSHNYLPVLGGAERQMAALIPRLALRGIDARVITRAHPGTPAHEVLGGVDVTRIEVDGLPRMGSILYTRGALQDLRKRPADVVHAHSLLSPATTALAAKARFRIPAVAKILRGGSLGDLVDLRRKGVGDLRYRMLAKGLDGFIAISREIEDELAALATPTSKRWFIPNGVDTARFTPTSRAERLSRRATLGVPGDPLVVFAGRLAPEKGLDMLFDAWSAVGSRHPGAGLVVLGEGPEAGRLRARAPEGVSFGGMVQDVRDHFAAADVFVLPSDAEGLSNSMLEAMAAGLAPIVTAVGGANDLVGPDVGWLVSVGDRDELAAALDQALSDSSELVHKGLAARRAVEADYSLEAVADSLARLYRHLAKL
jgi:glycosyltransferase involved in cell wall biosynthesis